MKVLISKNAGSSEIIPNNVDIGYEFDINNLSELQIKWLNCSLIMISKSYDR